MSSTYSIRWLLLRFTSVVAVVVFWIGCYAFALAREADSKQALVGFVPSVAIALFLLRSASRARSTLFLDKNGIISYRLNSDRKIGWAEIDSVTILPGLRWKIMFRGRSQMLHKYMVTNAEHLNNGLRQWCTRHFVASRQKPLRFFEQVREMLPFWIWFGSVLFNKSLLPLYSATTQHALELATQRTFKVESEVVNFWGSIAFFGMALIWIEVDWVSVVTQVCVVAACFFISFSSLDVPPWQVVAHRLLLMIFYYLASIALLSLMLFAFRNINEKSPKE